jgi:hypothetical protein
MNDNQYQTHNATVVNFTSFSGGKFVTNCLSLSQHACPQDPVAAKYLLTNPKDYDYRLKSILTTLPDKSQIKLWRSFEFGDFQLYGSAFKKWTSGNATPKINHITTELCNSNLKFFIINHSMNPTNLLQVWKNATVITLINSEKFQAVAMSLKNEKIINAANLNGNYCKQKFELLRGPDWPDWTTFENAGYDISKFKNIDNSISQEIEQFYPLQSSKNQVLFNIDACIFDVEKFLESMQALYLSLNFLDFRHDLVEKFYTKYISLHI